MLLCESDTSPAGFVHAPSPAAAAAADWGRLWHFWLSWGKQVIRGGS